MPEPDVYEAVPVSPCQLPSPEVICGSPATVQKKESILPCNKFAKGGKDCVPHSICRLHVGIHYRYYLQTNVSPLLQYRKHYLKDRGIRCRERNLPEEPSRAVSTQQSIVPLMDGMDCIRYVVGSAGEGGGSRAEILHLSLAPPAASAFGSTLI